MTLTHRGDGAIMQLVAFVPFSFSLFPSLFIADPAEVWPSCSISSASHSFPYAPISVFGNVYNFICMVITEEIVAVLLFAVVGQTLRIVHNEVEDGPEEQAAMVDVWSDSYDTKDNKSSTPPRPRKGPVRILFGA